MSPPLALTLADVPLRVEVVARVTVTDVAAQAVHTLSVTANVPAQPAFICLCFKKETKASHICKQPRYCSLLMVLQDIDKDIFPK